MNEESLRRCDRCGAKITDENVSFDSNLLCDKCSIWMDGYEHGRAEMKQELLGDGKPDGWCAWHPEHGWSIPSMVSYEAGSDSSWLLLIDPDAGGFDFSDLAQPEYNEDKFIERAKNEGWTVKPVKIIEVEE